MVRNKDRKKRDEQTERKIDNWIEKEICGRTNKQTH